MDLNIQGKCEKTLNIPGVTMSKRLKYMVMRVCFGLVSFVVGLTSRKQGQMATQHTLQNSPGEKPSIRCTSLQKRVVPQHTHRHTMRPHNMLQKHRRFPRWLWWSSGIYHKTRKQQWLQGRLQWWQQGLLRILQTVSPQTPLPISTSHW